MIILKHEPAANFLLFKGGGGGFCQLFYTANYLPKYLHIKTICLFLFLYTNVMKAKKGTLLPKEKQILEMLGENLKLARLRRKLTTEQLAERANIGRTSLWHVEKGSEHISIGIYLQVLSVLGLADDLKKIAEDDTLGRKLQDASLITKKRGSKIR